MAQKRMVRPSNTNYGDKGEAVVTKLDDNRIRLDFTETEKSYNFVVSQGNVFEEDSKANVPEHFPFKNMKIEKQIRVRATLNSDGSKVLYVNPYSGEYTVRFMKFQSPDENSSPVMETLKGKSKNGKENTYQAFYPFLEITKGVWKGCRLRGNLYNNFGKDPDDAMLTIVGTGKGSDNLEDFLDACGVEYVSIPFSENPLPEIQKSAIEAGREFSVMLVNGWIENYVTGLDDDAFDDGYPEEKEEHELLKD